MGASAQMGKRGEMPEEEAAVPVLSEPHPAGAGAGAGAEPRFHAAFGGIRSG